MRRNWFVSISVRGSDPRRFLAIAVLALMIGVPGEPAHASDLDLAGLRLAVVDFGKIRKEAAAVRSINAQLETYVASYQLDIEREEEALKRAQEEIDHKRGLLSPDAYAAEMRQWEKDVSEAQRRFLRRRQDLEKARADAWQQVNHRLDRIIKDVASERGIDIVIRRDQTVFVAPRFEITLDVLTRLDGELPGVDLLLPGG
jgi:outer membrane protein